MKKMSRWSNPTRRRNRIPAEIILITSGRVVVGDERPPLAGLCAAVDGRHCSLLTPMETNGGGEERVNVHTALDLRLGTGRCFAL